MKMKPKQKKMKMKKITTHLSMMKASQKGLKITIKALQKSSTIQIQINPGIQLMKHQIMTKSLIKQMKPEML